MNTLEVARLVTQEDIEKAKLMHFSWKADCILDGLKNDVEAVCREKGITPSIVNTVFAIATMRIESDAITKKED